MYLYRPEWVYLVRGWATVLLAVTAIAWVLAGFTTGLVDHPLLVWLLATVAMFGAGLLWLYVWALTKDEWS